MRRYRQPLSIARSFLFAFLVSATAASAATLGRGLEQLTTLYETDNPILASSLQLHIVAPDGAVMVHVRLDENAPPAQTLARLVASGLRITAMSEMDPTLVEGYVQLASARGLAAVPGVRHVLAVQRPRTLAGSVQSQAVAVQKADVAQARGVDGTGTRIGVLSDSFNRSPFLPNAATDIATGDIPADIVILQDDPDPGTDEGRAMLQLVHDVAPGAKLGFATADAGEVQFSNNILALRRSFHADVIVDDVIYFDEPMFSDGLLAQTVDKVVSEGAAYFSSAGNNSLEAYQANYDPISLAKAQQMVAEGKENIALDELAANGLPAMSFHNFHNRDGSTSFTQRFTSYFGDVVDFQWDEPFNLGKVKTDYNIYVFDSAGHLVGPENAFFTADDNTMTDQAIELFAVNPGTYQIVIAKVNNGPAQRIKYITVNGTGESEIQNAPSVWGHTAARKGQSVGAMFYGITKFPEDFSSPGPVTIYFDKRGNRLAEPDVRQVPQITAVDGADTTFFPPGGDIDGNGFPNFFGTSAAAPDAAAVAALVIQSSGGPGSISPADVYERLQDTATPIPLSSIRTLSAAFAGSLVGAASGDFPRETNYWTLAVEPFTNKTVKSVTIDLTAPNMHFSNPLSPTTGFHVGETHGLLPTDVVATRSLDLTSLTLTFTPGSFGRGDFLTFANFAFPVQLPVQFQVDADRVQGGQVRVVWSDNSTSTGTFLVAPAQRVNNFTGAGLVNADAATRRQHHRDSHGGNQ
jgi:hypothetical protein